MYITRPAVLRALITVSIALDGAAAGMAQETASPVVVSPVVEREVFTGRRVVGTVVPVRRSVIGSAVDGRVVEFTVEQGDPVTAGQKLAQLRTETLEIELAAARAELRLRQEELAELENGSRPEEIVEAEARMLAARAVRDNASKKLKRAEALYAQGALNQDEYDDARGGSESAEQTYRAAQASLELVQAGPRVEQIAQAKARVALQDEAIRLIEDRIAKHTIVAPFDGFVAAEHTEMGAWVQQGDPVAEIVELADVEVQANVPAEDAVRLDVGLPIRVEFPELPGEVFTGTVRRIVPTGDVVTRTFPVLIGLTNRLPEGRPLLLAGMMARLELPTGARQRMPLVPKDALVLNGPRRMVFVVDRSGPGDSRGTVRAVPVTLGVADGTRIQVDAPIKAGQLVVVRGNERLTDGQTVAIAQTLDDEPLPVERKETAARGG